jgi:hypothetical protein
LLIEADLSQEEAFLIAMKHIGNFDAVSQDFTQENSDLTFKQSIANPNIGRESGRSARNEMGLAIAAALAVKVLEPFGIIYGSILAHIHI